tara:strand:- start:868 stop:1323 length:456 start_codon:yes stop_codon:yes gene_type:complete
MNDILFVDIDGTLVDSNHRQNAEGKPDALDLDYWFANNTRENIFKDKPLPLYWHIRERYYANDYIVLCTARTISQDDLDYLAEMGIPYHSIISRPKKCDLADEIFKYNYLRKFLNLKWTQGKRKYLYDDKYKNLSYAMRLGIIPRYAKDWL